MPITMASIISHVTYIDCMQYTQKEHQRILLYYAIYMHSKDEQNKTKWHCFCCRVRQGTHNKHTAQTTTNYQ